MTPVWIFPCYPLLVIGPHASNLAGRLTSRPGDAMSIIIGAFVLQGIGFLLSLMIYAAYIYRLMTQKLPAANLRPGMFVSVGPSGFTIAGIVNMGLLIPRYASDDFLLPGNGHLAGQISKVCAIWMGLWLWGLAFWFFFVSVGAHWSCMRHGKMTFSMTFYSYVFPNTALTTATFAIAKALNNRPIRILGCVMTCLLICVWIIVFVLMIRAVWRKDILWPEKQERQADGHLKRQAVEGNTGTSGYSSMQSNVPIRTRGAHMASGGDVERESSDAEKPESFPALMDSAICGPESSGHDDEKARNSTDQRGGSDMV